MSVSVKKLRSSDPSFKQDLSKLLNREQVTDTKIDVLVAGIISDVANKGDDALFRLTKK